MNHFLKSNLRWLSLLGLAVFIVFMAFLFRPKTIEYQINTDQALKMMNNPSLQVAVQDIGGKQLIDIRTPELFAHGHPDNAINIPLRNLLNEESIELYNQLLDDHKEAIIYGSDELQAIAPWMLLQQLGYQNVKILKGGLSSTNEIVETLRASTETSILDISLMQAKTGSPEPVKAKPVKTTPITIAPVRKEASSGGGC